MNKKEELEISEEYRIIHCPMCDFVCNTEEELEEHLKYARLEITLQIES